MYVSFDEFTGHRRIATLGTNAGATSSLPFQAWRKFKEAFAPELIQRAISESKIDVARCVDPFGGSGTTSLACQFLGVQPTTVEVNPFLADLIEAKLSNYNADNIASDLGVVLRKANRRKGGVATAFKGAPPTFVEPGKEGRWIFDASVAARIAAIRSAIDDLPSAKHRRLFRVLLGGILTDVSNVIVSGKGRRYRRAWQELDRDPRSVDHKFSEAVKFAVAEIHAFGRRSCLSYDLLRGDARAVDFAGEKFDLAVFSPPYPNSFDYTDVYNVELWGLGYLSDSASNAHLRRSTLSSHVQIKREFAPPPTGSSKLTRAVVRLRARREDLWNPHIPEMVGAYFSDMLAVLANLRRAMRKRSMVWMIVGDSKYNDVHVRVADILADLVEMRGWKVTELEACRSMRASAQQGGKPQLRETLLVLTRT